MLLNRALVPLAVVPLLVAGESSMDDSRGAPGEAWVFPSRGYARRIGGAWQTAVSIRAQLDRVANRKNTDRTR